MLDIQNAVAAFTEAQVSGLTSLSVGQLRYWDRTGFYRAAWRDEEPHSPVRRLYSFRDLVALRTISMLRVSYNVPLQELRRVADRLTHLEDRLWTSTKLYVFNRRVVFDEEGTSPPHEVVSGQYVVPTELVQVVNDTRHRADELRRRPAEAIGNIERKRGILGRAPVVAGTRISVASVQRLAEDGLSMQEIIAEYPDLKEADVRTALSFPRAA